MKTGRCRVLIATDVASRGLDIKDLTHVLNYDFPRHIEDYVHRVGRTGRAGRTGTALTFISREDWMHVGKLIPILEVRSFLGWFIGNEKTGSDFFDLFSSIDVYQLLTSMMTIFCVVKYILQ